MIATFSDSIRVWSVLGWYGHIVVVGGLAFFTLGGSKVFRGVQKSCGVLPPAKNTPANGNGVKAQ